MHPKVRPLIELLCLQTRSVAAQQAHFERVTDLQLEHKEDLDVAQMPDPGDEDEVDVSDFELDECQDDGDINYTSMNMDYIEDMVDVISTSKATAYKIIAWARPSWTTTSWRCSLTAIFSDA